MKPIETNDGTQPKNSAAMRRMASCGRKCTKEPITAAISALHRVAARPR